MGLISSAEAKKPLWFPLGFHILFERKQHTGQPVMPECIGFFEASALFENAFLSENLIDAIHPFL